MHAQLNRYKTDHNCKVAEFQSSQLRSQFTAYDKDVNCTRHILYSIVNQNHEYIFFKRYLSIL